MREMLRLLTGWRRHKQPPFSGAAWTLRSLISAMLHNAPQRLVTSKPPTVLRQRRPVRCNVADWTSPNHT